MILRRYTIVVVLLACLPVLGGCGGVDEGPARYHVAGAVTYQGEPIPRGTIQFQPDGTKGNSGPASDAEIVDGRYDTSKQGTGTIGGPHIVVIQGFDGKANPEEELLLGMPLFSDFRTEADMPKSVEIGNVDFKVE